MRYKIFHSKGKDAKAAWVIEELPSKDNPVPRSFYAPAIEIYGFCQFMEMDQNATPQGWVEVEGQIFTDGETNILTIMNSTRKS